MNFQHVSQFKLPNTYIYRRCSNTVTVINGFLMRLLHVRVCTGKLELSGSLLFVILISLNINYKCMANYTPIVNTLLYVT